MELDGVQDSNSLSCLRMHDTHDLACNDLNEENAGITHQANIAIYENEKLVPLESNSQPLNP